MPHSSGFEIFRDLGNVYQRARLKPWPLVIGAVLLVCVAAANLWWRHAAPAISAMEEELAGADKSKAQLAQNVERLEGLSREIAEGLTRLREGDVKLREMMRLDKEANRAAQTDEASQEARRETDLQLTRLEAQEACARLLAKPARPVGVDRAGFLALGADSDSLLGDAPDAWPVEGVVSSGFGVRLSPFANQEEFHKGVDIMAPAGSPVRAPAPGRVAFSGQDAEGSLAVIVDHGGGYVTSFSHVQGVAVQYGQSVERGRILGLVAQDERSTGPHLHYEVRLYGAPVDPRRFLP